MAHTSSSLVQCHRWGTTAFHHSLAREAPSPSGRPSAVPALIKRADALSQAAGHWNLARLEPRLDVSSRPSWRILRLQAAQDSSQPSTSAQSAGEPGVASTARTHPAAEASTRSDVLNGGSGGSAVSPSTELSQTAAQERPAAFASTGARGLCAHRSKGVEISGAEELFWYHQRGCNLRRVQHAAAAAAAGPCSGRARIM